MLKNIFLLSNALTARTIMAHIDYVLSFPINNIFLLQENHSDEEQFFNPEGTTIAICNSLEACISGSDLTVVAKDDNFPDRTLNEVLDMAERFSKKLLVLSTPWTVQEKYKRTTMAMPALDYLNKPVIAIVSVGEYTTHYSTEIMINKIFAEKNAKMLQVFSPQAAAFLSDLSQLGCINPAVKECMNYPTSYDVIITYIQAPDHKQLTQMLNQLSPDALVICTDFAFDNSNNTLQFFKYGSGIDVCMVIKSEYKSYQTGTEQLYPVYCGCRQVEVESVNISNLLDPELKSKLGARILSKISFPKGIYPV